MRSPPIVVPPVFDDVDAALAGARSFGLEGVVVKDPGSTYRRGVRSESWLKVKLTRTQEVVIGGDPARARADAPGRSARCCSASPARTGCSTRGGSARGSATRRSRSSREVLTPLRTDENPFVGIPAARRARRAVGAARGRRRGGVRRVHARRHPAALPLARAAARQVPGRGRARELSAVAQACASCSTCPAGSSWNVECSTSKCSDRHPCSSARIARRPPVAERLRVDDDVRGEDRRAAGQLPDVDVVHVDHSRRREDVLADLVARACPSASTRRAPRPPRAAAPIARGMIIAAMRSDAIASAGIQPVVSDDDAPRRSRRPSR